MNRRSFLSLTGLITTATILPAEGAVMSSMESPLLEEETPLVMRQVMTLFEKDIAPGEIALFSFIPQRVFRPDRIIIPSHQSPYLELLDCDAMGEAITSATIPADFFSEVAWNPRIPFPVLQPGAVIDFALLNVSDRTLEKVYMGIIGDTIRH